MTQIEKESNSLLSQYRTIIRKADVYSNLASKDEIELAKQCALMEVNAIIKVLFSLKFGNALSEEIEHYEKLKQEIEKL